MPACCVLYDSGAIKMDWFIVSSVFGVQFRSCLRIKEFNVAVHRQSGVIIGKYRMLHKL